MGRSAISIQNISKEYIIGLRENANESFREMLTSTFAAPFRRFRSLGGQAATEAERFWALKDVSFEVNEGEVIGIIGRNGAGKSTLLKILSRITEPTSGRISMRGRVASLLEVGTGFHPELTGRENVYLNGAILGMTQAEINRKFDEIIDFAGIEKFLDTPVKRYSSGMYVRLAFSVAAHLEPEILVVDEVLAVGDAEFQKKCLGKMKDVSGQGRTVLLVSHNMNAIQTLCHRAVLLEKGQVIAASSNVKHVIDRLLNAVGGVSSIWRNTGDAYKTLPFIPRKLFIGDAQGNLISSSIANDEPAYVHLIADVGADYNNLCIGYTVTSDDGVQIYTSCNIDCSQDGNYDLAKGRVHLRTPLPRRTLNEGRYFVRMNANFHHGRWMFDAGAGAQGFPLKSGAA